jgi:alkyldihydroxyacetonephosphate synthase
MGDDLEELTRRLVAACGVEHVEREARRFLVRPGAAAEIAEVVRLAGAHGGHVVPLGTGSKRRDAGGEDDRRPLVVLDMTRLDNVLHLDETSLTVHAQAGLTGLALEDLLAPRGLTLGDFAPAALTGTLGGLLAVRTPGKSSPRHGFFEDAVLGASAVLPDGRTVHTRVAPRRATGPDLARALLGSEGVLGIIASVVLRIHRRPETRQLAAWRVPSLAAGVAVVRAALKKDVRPAAARVYDAAEAEAHLGHEAGGVVLVTAFAGPAALVQVEVEVMAAAVDAHGGQAAELALAETWWRRRSGQHVGGHALPTPALVVWAHGTQLADVHAAIVDAAERVGRTARAHIARFDDDGACVFVTLPGGGGEIATARTACLAAARAAGAHAPGEREDGWIAYAEAVKHELDPRGVLT